MASLVLRAAEWTVGVGGGSESPPAKSWALRGGPRAAVPAVRTPAQVPGRHPQMQGGPHTVSACCAYGVTSRIISPKQPLKISDITSRGHPLRLTGNKIGVA